MLELSGLIKMIVNDWRYFSSTPANVGYTAKGHESTSAIPQRALIETNSVPTMKTGRNFRFTFSLGRSETIWSAVMESAFFIRR